MQPAGARSVYVAVIDLKGIRPAAGAPRCSAAKLLEILLGAWGARYELLYDADFEWGVEEFLNEEYARLEREMRLVQNELNEDPHMLALRVYARWRGADGVVILYDGSGSAAALTWRPRGGDSAPAEGGCTATRTG